MNRLITASLSPYVNVHGRFISGYACDACCAERGSDDVDNTFGEIELCGGQNGQIFQKLIRLIRITVS